MIKQNRTEENRILIVGIDNDNVSFLFVAATSVVDSEEIEIKPASNIGGV